MSTEIRKPAGAAAIAATRDAPAAGGLSSAQLEQLSQSNPKTEALIKENPGVAKLLARSSVSSGPRPGESRTEIAWGLWTHSEKTNAKYGHGMKDAQIKSDYIVVFQPSADPKASVTLGRNSYPGQEIVGVYKAGDHLRMNAAYDGGHLGEIDVVGHGKKGEQAVYGWAILGIAEDGRALGGGFPTSRDGKVVAYQDQKGAGGGGGEYWGRGARVTQGATNNHVPITDN